MTQPEAKQTPLPNLLDKVPEDIVLGIPGEEPMFQSYTNIAIGKLAQQAAYELRRLHADNEKKSEAIQRLWKERDELRDSNEAKADRIDRLGETVEKLKAQRKPLSDDEIRKMRHLIDWTAEWTYITFARAIEAAHGIKGET